MAKTVADIAIGVTADIGPLMRETSRAKAEISRFGQVTAGLGNAFTKAGDKATALGAKMSIVTGIVGGVAAGLAAITRNAADMGEEIANGAKAAGMSTTAFQEYKYALSEAADMSGEDFAAATVRLNKRLGEAANGSKSAQAAFDALGISASDIASGTVTTDQAMAALVSTLENTKDPALAAAIASDILGRSGSRMGGLLAGTAGQVDDLRARAQALGIVMSGEAVDASDKFNEQWDATVKQFDAVKVAIATSLMPIIVNDLIPMLQNTVIPAIVDVVNQIGVWAQAFSDLPGPVKTAIEIVAGLFAVGGPLLLAIGTTASVIGALVAATGPIGLLIAAAGLLTAAWVMWGDDFKAAIGAAITWATEKFNAFMTIVDNIIAKLKEWGSAAQDFLSINGAPMIQGGNGDPRSNPRANPGGNGPAGMPAGGAGSDMLGGGAGSDMLGGGAMGDTLGTEPPAVARARVVHTMLQQLEVEHQTVMEETAATAEETRKANYQSFQNSLGVIAQAGGEKTLKAFEKFAAAEAEINAVRAAMQTFADPNLGFFQKFAAVAAVTKATSRLMGAFGGGGKASQAASVGAASAPASANITINGDYMKTSSVKDLIDQLNSGFKQGYRLNLVTA